jgi:putative membrane protein
MLGLILVWILSAAALLLTSKMVKGFEIKDFGSAMIASLMIGFLNMILRPILLLLTLPLNILTLGLFTFVVNAIVLKSAAGILKGFNIKTWGDAIIGAVVLAVVQLLINFILPY